VGRPGCVFGEMKEVSDAQKQAGRDWLTLRSRNRAEIQRNILRFLQSNPDSTADEIWTATGYSWDNALKFVKRHRRGSDNRMVYSVDHKKLAAYLS
jgi:hypothetical protein